MLNHSGIKPGMKIMEVSCGSGAFTTFTAEAVGNGGAKLKSFTLT